MPVWLENDPRPLDWNGPTHRSFAAFHDEGLDRPIIDHFERAARRHWGEVAVWDADTALTYGELWRRLSGLAETLAAETSPGDLIGILLPACPMFPLSMLACLAAGRPFVVLDTHYPKAWLEQVFEDARPALVITPEYLANHIEPAQEDWRPAPLAVDEPACVLFTSGSTGRPKGIVNSQRNLLQRVAQSINAAHISADDRFLTLASPCTIVGVRDTLTALLAGAGVRLLDPHAGAREILNVIRAEAITILFAFPAFLRTIVAASAQRAPATLRLVRVGGDTTLWSDIDALHAWLSPRAAIQVIYAATEAPMLQWFVADNCRGEDPRVPIGYPLPGNTLAIVDEHARAVPPGEIGELVVASRYVALGRWAKGRCTREGIARFHTGDLVRQRPDGLLERVGRQDRQVKIRGTRVDLDGVEAVLRSHAAVRDVAALARTTNAEGTNTLVAYVRARAETPADLIAELQTLMRSVPPPMRPARFYLVPEIPRLPSSKLDVRGLAALDDANARSERASPSGEAAFVPDARDCIAQAVARVWATVLRAPPRGAGDDFFDCGGDSLKAITFTLELERALRRELSLTLVNEAPRFGELCEALRDSPSAGYVPLVPLKAGEGRPPIFFIHGVGGNVVEILPTARRMRYPGAVIGIRARGLARGEVPHSSVHAMAAEYLRAIKAYQPHGPYYLCGYSFGGVVAFEIARQLSESGDEVGLVGLFDTLMSPLRWPLRSWIPLLVRTLGHFVSGRRALSLRSWTATTRAIGVAASALMASARYRPGLYRGHLTLFAPAGREPGLPSLETLWRKHALTVSTVETAGTHSTMLSAANADSTAASLTRCLTA